MDHLHELVNVMAHHLVRRNARNFPHLPGGKELVGTIHGHFGVRPNVGTNFLFPLTRHLLLLERTSHLLNRNARRSSSTLVQIKGRCGRASLHHLFLFLFLLISNSQPPLTYARKRLILLVLNFLIHLFVKLGHHFYTKEFKDEEKENRKLRTNKKKEVKNEEERRQIYFKVQLTFFLFTIEGTEDVEGRLWPQIVTS